MASLIGKPLPRVEDLRLVAGKGRFTDDIHPPGALWMYVLRSPHAHAVIADIRPGTAAAAPGVLAVLTAADYRADGNQPIQHQANPPDALDVTIPSFFPEPGTLALELPQPPFAEEKVRHVGEAVALVIAETLDQARDAAELIEVDYDLLPAVVSAVDALAEGAPRICPSLPGNLCLQAEYGDAEETGRAFRAASFVIEREFHNQRIVNCQMEPRSAVGLYDRASGIYTLITGSQGVVRQRIGLAAALSVPKEQVQVLTHDVGGGFGPRTSLYPESVLVAWAAKRLGRPVRWTCDRSDSFLSDYQGRDLATRAALAFDAGGRITAFRTELIGNLGAYPASFAPLANGCRVAPTVYDVPVALVKVRAALTNTTPTVPYRGAGRPEATFVIERLLDLAAKQLGLDRIDLRRRNLIPKHKLPYRTAVGLTYDSGDFHGNMELALERADWQGFAERRSASLERGLRRGIGLANYVETPVGAAREKVVVTVRADGTVEVVSGTQSTGQGHETTFAQVVADTLGVPFDAVRLFTGDSRVVDIGGGTHSDRSMRLVGTLLVRAGEELIARGRALAASLLDCDPAQVGFAEGLFTALTTNRSIDLFDLARTLEQQAAPSDALSATADMVGRIAAYPTGCAVCELEVDPETGVVRIERYTCIDDVGTPINPLIVDGQVHGGIAQGVGQALYEFLAVDGRDGQVAGGSFMDYAVPRADRLPSFDVELTKDPTTTPGNRLGVKGSGESGTTPATAAVINALVDALDAYGIEHMEMPATPRRVWNAIQSAQGAERGARR
jgi:carbon-monoxide dehydrogenase large subunit